VSLFVKALDTARKPFDNASAMPLARPGSEEFWRGPKWVHAGTPLKNPLAQIARLTAGE